MNHAFNAIRRSPLGSGIEQIILDMPGKSANVLTKDFLEELSATIDQLERSPDIAGVVISSAKPGIYIAGADIVAISKSLDWGQNQIIEFCRHGQSLLDRLANLPIVVIAAIQGVCVGGGLEFALACDARVVANDGKSLLGLPEVKLGLIPGWAGTVRLPRLIGLHPAIDLVTSGRLVSAASAHELGLVDAIVEPQLLIETATELAKTLNSDGTFKNRRSSRRQAITNSNDVTQIEAEFVRAIESNRELHLQAPLVALRHMIDSAGSVFAEACEKEAVAMSKVYGSEACAGLINSFFLNERAKKSGRFAGVRSTELQAVGVVGAGVMGGDIAEICPSQKPIAIYDLDPARASAVAERCNARPNSASPARVANNLGDLTHCDLVIESIVEDVSAKRELLGVIEARLNRNAILTSNTSVIRISEMAEALRRPDRFCGLHFCYPAKVRRLVEVVRGPKTSNETMASVCEWVRAIGKIPLPVRDAPGFIINRLLCPMFNEAGHLLTQGCRLRDIEDAVRGFGFAFGPLEFMDAIGLDTLNAAGAYLIPRLTTPTEPSLLLHAMNKAGWKGRKSGRGFYAYPAAESPAQPNDQLDALIAQYLRGTTRPPGPDEIVRRLLMVMINQAADALAENVVLDSAEIDLAFLHGAGFPEHRGGLIFWARRQGLPQLVDEMRRWGAAASNARRYCVSSALEELAREGA